MFKLITYIDVFVTCLMYVHCIHDHAVLNLYKSTFNGDGTYYGKSEGGACSMNRPNLPPVAHNVDKLVALNSPQFFGSASCGLCLKITGTGNGLGNDPITGSFTAYVKDLCPECHAGDVDLAENGDGRWDISIQAIQCPVTSPIEYTLEGSNNYYIKLKVRNDRMPTTTLEMYQPNHGSWAKLTRSRDGFWLFPNDGTPVDKPIHLPFRLRLHAPNGEVIEDEVNPPSMSYTGVFHGKGVQYAKDPSLPSADSGSSIVG
ncbi:hypothetical protein ACF0H5_013022 [Mactra antiquata]